MKLDCGCRFQQLPDDAIITPCGGAGHRMWVIVELAKLVERLEEVDIDTGKTVRPERRPMMTPEQLREEFLKVDLRAELIGIGALSKVAIDALNDEHEAELKARVVELHSRAAACLHLVATW